MKTKRALLATCLTSVVLSVTACTNQPVEQSAAASSTAAANGGQAGGRQAGFQVGDGTPTEVAADFIRRCKNASADSLECEVFRSLLVGELTRALERAEISRDKRAVERAVAALALTEEPEVIIAACRVLGRFADTPNLAAKMVPLMLESPYLEVQRMAANVLAANPDQSTQELGRLWAHNHEGFNAESPYDEYPDFPDHYAGMGFPKYPGAEWFAPADSDRSIGWSTTDDAAAVARWFGNTLHADVLDPDQWTQVSNQQLLLPMQTLMDPAKTARMQQLMERIVKGQADKAANDEYAKLAKEIDDRQGGVNAALENSIHKATIVEAALGQGARWIVAQKKGERISRLVIVFPVPSIKRTAIKLVWDLSDYPSAWPKPKG